jgi:NADH dehydrogenase
VTRIVVLGAGFGGLYAASYLHSEFCEEPEVKVTLIDRNNYHTFYPLLPEVAAGALVFQNCTYPVRQRGFSFLQSEVREIDLQKKEVITESLRVPYDYLIIALGSVTNFFGMKDVEEHALTLKTLTDAIRIKNHTVRLFEEAVVESDPGKRAALLTFVVAGGGPAGVEVAAELRHWVRETLSRYYPEIDLSEVKISLIHAGPRILPHLNEDLSEYAYRDLVTLGVEVLLNTRVTGAREDAVLLEDGAEIPSRTLIWTTGIRSNPVLESLPTEKDDRGRIKVNRYLQVEGFEGVYAVGDNAHFMDERRGRSLPQVAPVAIHGGIRAAGNIINQIQDRPVEPFRYHAVGDIVSLGGGSAIVVFLGMEIRGRLAWLLSRTNHLLKLVGARNKFQLFTTWIANLFFDRDTSYILRETKLIKREGKG